MRKLTQILTIVLTLSASSLAFGEQFPSTGEEMLSGLQTWSKILAHKCSDGDCAHFTVKDSARGVAAFDYLKGYVAGVRVTQVATNQKLVLLPERGVDCTTLITPLIGYLQSRPNLKSQDLSVTMFLFLKTRYPVKL